MISLIEDNTTIYFLLEKTNVLFDDFSKDHVIGFDHEDDFCIAIYISETRNFLAFVSKGHMQNTNSFPELMEMVQKTVYIGISEKQTEKALEIIENRMLSKNNSRFYFDAH